MQKGHGRGQGERERKEAGRKEVQNQPRQGDAPEGIGGLGEGDEPDGGAEHDPESRSPQAPLLEDRGDKESGQDGQAPTHVPE